MSSGMVSQLPDSLQWQIRTLLPRKDGRPLSIAPAPVRLGVELPVGGQGGLGLPMPASLGFGSCGLQMPTQPHTAPVVIPPPILPLVPTVGC